MNHTGAFRALARYLDREDRCLAHPRCVLAAGHAGPPRVGRSDHNPTAPECIAVVGPGEGQ